MHRDRRCLWSLLLSANLSHANVVQELGDSGCIAESAQAGGNAGSRPVEDTRVATGSSMMQVSSKKQLHMPEEAVADSFEAQAVKIVISGNGTALASFLKMVHSHSGRTPTFLLVIICLLLAGACAFTLASRGVGDGKTHLVGLEGRAGSPKDSGIYSASSLPPRGVVTRDTSGISRTITRSPVQSARDLTMGPSPGSAHLLPPQSGLPMVASKHLCPGLVVPHGNECILAVPTMPAAGSTDMATLNVQDLEGRPVIQADVVMPHSARASDTQRAIVVLRAGSAPRVGNPLGAPLLAYCKAGYETGSRRTVYIYNGRDELFAQISRSNTNWYVLSRSVDGVQLFLEGDIRYHAVTVTNEQSLVVSESSSTSMSFNPGGSYYKLRVAANVDVGLILCALFSMDFLERS